MLSQALRSLGFAAASALLYSATATAPASAQPPADWAGAGSSGDSSNVVCRQTGRTMNCTTTWGSGNGIPLVVDVLPPEDESARTTLAQRIRKWETYCQPELRYDRLGVGRYVYRVAGCEHGRSQD